MAYIPTVFISYAREDKQVAEAIANYLRSNRLSVWIDINNLLVGQTWEAKITHAIRHSQLFLILLSHNSTEKDSYCAKELAEARFHASIIGWHGPFICPIRLNEHVDPQLGIKHLHVFDLFSVNEENLARLLKDIKMVMPQYRVAVRKVANVSAFILNIFILSLVIPTIYWIQTGRINIYDYFYLYFVRPTIYDYIVAALFSVYALREAATSYFNVGGIPHIHESIANNRLKVFFVELKTAVIG
jgi:TIR domain